MIEQVIAILNDIVGAGEGELDADLDLFDAGLLDSFGVVQLLVELEERLHVVVDIASLTREEIATPSLIARRVERAL